jgi:hypothetical protein
MSSPSSAHHHNRMKGRLSGAALTFVTALGALPLAAATAQAQPGRALADPPANVPRTEAMAAACAAGTGPSCQAVVLHAIDRARGAEGLGPLDLPAGYGSLTMAQQLFVLADIERTDRGLPGLAGLSSQLDSLAQVGASTNSDPVGPAGASWGSNWAGGEASALLADYDWMYDDGPGSPNLDCDHPSSTGCWDHRQNILGDYGAHPSMGAASTMVDGVTSMTELFSSGSRGVLEFTLRGPGQRSSTS